MRQGPDPERHKVVRWRLVDLRDEIARRFCVQLHERSVGKLLARLNFSHVSARPRHPGQDAAAAGPGARAGGSVAQPGSSVGVDAGPRQAVGPRLEIPPGQGRAVPEGLDGTATRRTSGQCQPALARPVFAGSGRHHHQSARQQG
ncbi:MAG TPA: hypothetical protein DDZ81_23970 [Acetobacteraceae bacterium]|nr:hypothetical protein [Acetobacteraceae bacterium]